MRCNAWSEKGADSKWYVCYTDTDGYDCTVKIVFETEDDANLHILTNMSQCVFVGTRQDAHNNIAD